LDVELVRRRLAGSRAEAAALIEAGAVLVAGAPAVKPSRLVGVGEPVVVSGPGRRFVSRGGEKLEAALDRFGIDPGGKRVLDAGSSTGGFTDCLLQRGACEVTSVDVGRAQLHERLRADTRVRSLERTDIRSLTPDQVGGPFDLVVADLSFIPVRAFAPSLLELASPGGEVVVLVKPQFEAGRAEVSRGRGVIRDPAIWRRVLVDAIDALRRAGASIMGAMVSPLRGADGNAEFLVYLRRVPGVSSDAATDLLIDSAVGAAVGDPAQYGR
jgi:23S rRNA (cytidine1920-2'-O)/16S rRNA (cytidine1409-2'-O)-methyltransferase